MLEILDEISQKLGD